MTRLKLETTALISKVNYSAFRISAIMLNMGIPCKKRVGLDKVKVKTIFLVTSLIQHHYHLNFYIFFFECLNDD